MPLSQLNVQNGVFVIDPEAELVERPPPAPKAEAPKSPSKQPKPKAASKPHQPQKELKKPTVEEAAKTLVTSTQISDALGRVRTLYPDNAFLWFKEIVSHLSVKFKTCAETEFRFEHQDDFFNMLTKESRKVLNSTIESQPKNVLEGVFGNLTSNLAHELASAPKNADNGVLGHLMVLQALAESSPALCLAQEQRAKELLNSYRNRSRVTTALLWVLGLGGRKNLAVGLQGESKIRDH